MRTRFDQFSKRVLAACLAEVGDVETEREISAEPAKVDVWFVPHEGPAISPRSRIGSRAVLRAMARHSALIEPFHQTPSVSEILACVGKQHSVHAELLRADRDAQRPFLWIVSSGLPRTAIAQLGFVQLPRARGLYRAARGFRLLLVVVSGLQGTRDTLLLRLLGAGRTFVNALQELLRLPADAWESRVTRPWLVRYQIEIRSRNADERTPEEEAIMKAQGAYEEWEREVTERGKALGLDEGKALGLDEGKRNILLHQLRVKFGVLPPWTEQRVNAGSAAQLDSWAERVVTRASLDDIFAEP